MCVYGYTYNLCVCVGGCEYVIVSSRFVCVYAFLVWEYGMNSQYALKLFNQNPLLVLTRFFSVGLSKIK